MRINALVLAAVSGALTVTLGAFGAHALKDRLSEHQLDLWQTAVLYQGLHVPALGLVGLLGALGVRARVAGIAFVVGTLIFSGTVYALALGAPSWFGAITPIGGTALIVGWVALALAARGLGAGPMTGGASNRPSPPEAR